MGGSIHIHGKASSIIDTVFVCRSTGAMPRRWLADTPDELVSIVADDLDLLAAAGRKPTRGDTRCIVFGHLTRMAAWHLRPSWDRTLTTPQKIVAFATAVAEFRAPEAIVAAVHPNKTPPGPLFASIRDHETQYAVPF